MSRKEIEIMGEREEQWGQEKSRGGNHSPQSPLSVGLPQPCRNPSQHGQDLQSMWQSDRMKAAPSLGTQLRNHQKRCSGHLLFWSLLFIVLPKSWHLPPTSACSWELAGGWGLHPVDFAKPPGVGTIALTTSKPRCLYRWHPHHMFLLPAHAWQA